MVGMGGEARGGDAGRVQSGMGAEQRPGMEDKGGARMREDVLGCGEDGDGGMQLGGGDGKEGGWG